MHLMMSTPTDAAPEARPAPSAIPLRVRLPLAGGALLLLLAAVCQYAIGPAVSPGFSYLAVMLALGGIGVLLAAGLAE